MLCSLKPSILQTHKSSTTMNIDVGKSIKELLFEHPAVVVPGLGGFTSSPSSSTVDYVQGVVLPPSKKLEFNPNLVINDGVLVNHIQKGSTVTFQEAGDVVSRYVEEVKQALERREIVEISQVGRLYKDYEHKVRFMPEGENFNADSFGLPAIQFTPLVKERSAAATTAAVLPPTAASNIGNTPPVTASTSTASTYKTTPYSSGSNWTQRMLPWLVLLAAILLAASVYLIFGGKDKTEEPIAKERLNVKPKSENDLAGTDNQGEILNEKPAEKAPEKAATPTPPPAQQKSAPDETTRKKETSPPAGLQKTFIVVHSFGVRNNATKFAERLSEAGYSPETQKVGKLYRVGIILPHKTDAEVQAMKTELGKKFDAKPKTEKELDEQEGR